VDQTGNPAVKNGSPKMIWIRDQHDPKEVALIKSAVAELLKGASLRDVAPAVDAAKVPQPQTGRSNWTPASLHGRQQTPAWPVNWATASR